MPPVCCAVAFAGADVSRPVPPTPRPVFASSQLPRRVLLPCHTPVRFGFPSGMRDGELFAGVCAYSDAAAITSAIGNMRMSSPRFLSLLEAGAVSLTGRRVYTGASKRKERKMRTMKNLYFVLAAAVFIVLAAVTMQRIHAQQPVADAPKIDNDDIGGVVSSSNGPEAGVWVIAET